MNEQFAKYLIKAVTWKSKSQWWWKHSDIPPLIVMVFSCIYKLIALPYTSLRTNTLTKNSFYIL